MLVKTAHVKFPKLMLRETEITRGEWNTLTGEVEGVPVMAVLFKDLQEKQFISSCNLSIEGEPRVTKHCGEIARPAVAETYLKNCAGIDIHNHFRTGSSGLEDVWQTKNYIHRQFAGITGFIFTNAFLAMRHFSKINGIANIRGEHAAFKHILSDQLLNFRDVSRCTRTVRLQSSQVHTLARIGEKGSKKQLRCFYCMWAKIQEEPNKTSWYCKLCGIDKPLCSPELRNCFDLHEKYGMPSKGKRADAGKPRK